MFAQVIQGRTSDADALQAAMDRWMQDLQPGSIGWLGSTLRRHRRRPGRRRGPLRVRRGRGAQLAAAGADPVVGGDAAGCSRGT